MERTPSPPRRVHTPPAPMHGAKHDSYEPYSPRRRSSRVAAQRELQSPKRQRTTRDVTPVPQSKKSAVRASDFTLSPPSSPISPDTHREPHSTRRANHEPAHVDSDAEHIAPRSTRRRLSAMEPRGMLPTPAKTPRKRTLHAEELSSTARVLFHSRPATIEDAMPTPSKSRKGKKNLFSLDSFDEQMKSSESKIKIYTDSHDRIPTSDDEAEENPFIIKKGKGKAKAALPKSRKLDAETIEMNEAVSRGEGIIYTFRGRKVFRRYNDVPPPNTSGEAPESSITNELRRKAGAEAHRPLTRSSVKPRLLFQEEIKQRRKEKGEVDSDEAITDIDLSIATPSRMRRKDVGSGSSTARRARREVSFEAWSRHKSVASSSSTEERKRSAEDSLQSTADKRARIR